jgi:hypothetical protein
MASVTRKVNCSEKHGLNLPDHLHGFAVAVPMLGSAPFTHSWHSATLSEHLCFTVGSHRAWFMFHCSFLGKCSKPIHLFPLIGTLMFFQPKKRG